jgi:hypothetical protein
LADPASACARILEKVARRIDGLGLTKENDLVVKRTFLLDFVDQIDVTFDIQKRVRANQFREASVEFCRQNARITQELSVQRVKVLSRAAETFQWVRSVHPISYNLYVALKALHPLAAFEQPPIALAIAMSNNPEVPAFVEFLNTYLMPSPIADVIMTEAEKQLLADLAEASQLLTVDFRQVVTGDETDDEERFPNT